MDDKVNAFHIHDNGFHIWLVSTRDEVMDASSRPWMLRVAAELRKRGWQFMIDPAPLGKRNNHHRKYFRYAKRGDLEMWMWASGCHLQIEFFQNLVNQTHANGRYGFDHLKRMPFLLRCRTRVEHRFLTAWCLQNGLADHCKVVPRLAMDRIEQDRAESMHWPKDRALWPDFIERNRSQRNCIDKDQVQLNDGDERYFWYEGRLQRCRVYYNLNTQWWAVMNDTTLLSISSGQFFSCADTGTLPRRYFPDLKGVLRGHLAKAVRDKQFLRAHHLQRVLGEKFPETMAA